VQKIFLKCLKYHGPSVVTEGLVAFGHQLGFYATSQQRENVSPPQSSARYRQIVDNYYMMMKKLLDGQHKYPTYSQYFYFVAGKCQGRDVRQYHCLSGRIVHRHFLIAPPLEERGKGSIVKRKGEHILPITMKDWPFKPMFELFDQAKPDVDIISSENFQQLSRFKVINVVNVYDWVNNITTETAKLNIGYDT
jgi:hypothetical protein